MSDELRLAWDALLERVGEVAPATRLALHSSIADVAGAEAKLGFTLSDELRVWFEIVEGTTMIPTGQVFPDNNAIGLETAVDLTLSTRQTWGDSEPRNYTDDLRVAGTVTWTWRDGYVYVGIDGMGGGLFVDLRQGPLHGCVRWWDKVDADGWQPEPLATGMTDLVVRVLDALNGGEAVHGLLPMVNPNGWLTWDVQEQPDASTK